MAEIDTNSQEFKDAVSKAIETESAGVHSALKKERENAKAAKASLAAFEGIDPDQYRKMVTEREQAEAQRQKSQGDWDARELKLQESFDAKLTTVMGERDAALSERDAKATALDTHLRGKAAIEEIAAQGGSIKLLEDIVLRNTKLVEDDGKQVIRVLDTNGVPRLKDGAKNAADFMGLPEYVASLKDSDDFARAFEGSGASGVGSSRVAAGSQGSDVAKRAARLQSEGVKVHTAG